LASSLQTDFSVYRSRRALVLGASGFIGRCVAGALSAAHADLFLVARDANRLAEVCSAYEIRGEILAADLTVPGAFTKVHGTTRPDITFNLAGCVVDSAEHDAAMAESLNANLVREAAQVLASQSATDWPGLRLVHAGSGKEYGNVHGLVTEDLPPAPHNLYGRTKLAGTHALQAAVKSNKLRAVCARLFSVYGPDERPGRLLHSLLGAARSKTALALTGGEQQRDFTYVGEVAEGLLRLGCVRGSVPAVVHLATGTLTTVRAFAECASDLLHMPPGQLQFGTLPERVDEFRQGRVSTRLLEQTVGWRPTLAVRDGIRETLAFESRRCGMVT
jgi:nucleoside-diphosphate-sugar epimerase